MTELIVRVPYKSKARVTTLWVLKAGFPFWGLIGPIAGLLLVSSGLTGLALGSPNAACVGVGATLLCIFALCIYLTNLLSRDALVIDKDGLQLPFNPLRRRQSYTWQSINKVVVSRGDTNDLSKKELVFFTKARTLKVALAGIPQDKLEEILLAMEIWGENKCEIDSSVAMLKHDAGKSASSDMNYTDMWEDELQRRFSSVAFVPLEPGQVLRNGTLRVVRHLALGGLSAVYLCQLEEKQLVVLKEAVVSADAVETTQLKAREMLDREAALLLKLSNPNIVKVLDYFVEQGRNYLMLEYIDGQDLRQLVRQNGPRRESVVLEWAVSMAGMLKYLHEQQPPLIHRDFTPDNIVISNEGSLYLIDFGASNEFIGTATGTFVGKQAFIAPEQFRGKACVQSDIYAFGCTLYFLITGQEPEALCTSNPADINPKVSKELSELIVSCTQMEPANRYQSAAQLIPVLRSLATPLHTPDLPLAP